MSALGRLSLSVGFHVHLQVVSTRKHFSTYFTFRKPFQIEVATWTFKLFRHEKTFAQHLHLVALVLPYIGKLCNSQKIQMIDNKYFICELCGKVFTPASNMHKHIVTTVVRNHCYWPQLVSIVVPVSSKVSI